MLLSLLSLILSRVTMVILHKDLHNIQIANRNLILSTALFKFSIGMHIALYDSHKFYYFCLNKKMPEEVDVNKHSIFSLF